MRGVVESLKIITRQASLRVAEYAFHYAKAHGRERVSAIHKANIMQKTDGLSTSQPSFSSHNRNGNDIPLLLFFLSLNIYVSACSLYYVGFYILIH